VIEAAEALLRDARGPALRMLGVAALAILLGGIAIVRWRTGARSAGVRVALPGASLVALGALGTALFSLVQGARAELLAVLHQTALPADRVAHAVEAVDLQLSALVAGSAAMAIAAPIAIGAAALSLRRPAVVVAAGCALGVTAGALASLAYAHEIGGGLSALANDDPGARGPLVHALLERAETRLDLGRVVIVVTAALTALAAARGGAAMRARGWIGAATLFVAGLLAFAATRDLAHDSEHPRVSDGIPHVPSLPGLDVPELERCTVFGLAPAATLILHGGTALLDGRPATSPDALLLRSRRPGALYIECDATAPIAAVRPWLSAAHRGGYAGVHVIGQRVSRLETRTLGTLIDREVCDAELALDTDGEPLGRHATWAALARAAERASGDLRVAP